MAGVTAIVVVAIAVITIDNIQFFAGSDDIIAEPTLMLMSVTLLVTGLGAIAIGFVVMNTRPAEGAALVVGGSLAAALMTYWLIVPLLIGTGLSVYAVRRAMRIAGSVPKG